MFDEATHTYTLDGQKLPSVTEILAPITAGKYPPSGVVQQAAARGTRIHELCALYDMDALPEEFEGELVPYVQAWADFCRDYTPEWLYIEQPFYFDPGIPKQRYAGTVDRVGIVDGRLVVVDIKTAQNLDRPAKVALACQLHAYRSLAEPCFPDVLLDGEDFGVQLMKDGNYRIHMACDISEKYGFAAFAYFGMLRNLYAITKGY